MPYIHATLNSLCNIKLYNWYWHGSSVIAFPTTLLPKLSTLNNQSLPGSHQWLFLLYQILFLMASLSTYNLFWCFLWNYCKLCKSFFTEGCFPSYFKRSPRLKKSGRLLRFNTTADRSSKSNSRSRWFSCVDFAGVIFRILAVENPARRSTTSAGGAQESVTSKPSARVPRSPSPMVERISTAVYAVGTAELLINEIDGTPSRT